MVLFSPTNLEIQLPWEAAPAEEFVPVGPQESLYFCGGAAQIDENDAATDVTFDYDIHYSIDVALGDALKDVKQSILSDIAGRLGFDKTSGRRLQESTSDSFDNVIAVRSNSMDMQDPNASGCDVEVEAGNPTTCTQRI